MKKKVSSILIIIVLYSINILSLMVELSSGMIKCDQGEYLKLNSFFDDTIKYSGWRADQGTVRCISYNKDGNILASCGDENVIKFWDPKTGFLLKTLSGHTDAVNSINFSPDGTKLISGSNDHTVRLWDVKSGNEIMTFTGLHREVHSVVFSPDGKYIAAGCGYPYTLKIWNTESGQLMKSYTGIFSDDILCLAFSPDGKNIATGTSINEVIIWNTDSDSIIFNKRTESYSEVSSLCYEYSGKKILDGGGRFILWDLTSSSIINEYGMNTKSFVYSKDKHIYFIAQMKADTYYINIWNSETFSLLKKININDILPNSISLSPDENYIACGGWVTNKNILNLRIYPISDLLSISNISKLPDFMLDQNYPNPFNPTTKIKYKVGGITPVNVIIKIYDILGKEMKTLINENKYPGNYDIVFDGSNFASGLYIYKIIAGNYSQEKTMILLK
jgi:WD40 repeat protein